MNNRSRIFQSLQTMERRTPPYAAHWITPQRFGHLVLVQTKGREYQEIVELITQWVLRGSFYLITGGEWFPDHDDLRYSVFRYTNAIDETLDRLILARARTCMQLLDLLTEADQHNKPVLILDFLPLFYDQDLDLSFRDKTLEKCCRFIKRLSLSNPVAVLEPTLDTSDYKRFFPVLASIADEIIPVKEASDPDVSQGFLF